MVRNQRKRKAQRDKKRKFRSRVFTQTCQRISLFCQKVTQKQNRVEIDKKCCHRHRYHRRERRRLREHERERNEEDKEGEQSFREFLLLLCLPIFFRSHLPSLPSGDLPDVLEEEVVAHLPLVPCLGLGVVALAAVDARVLGQVHLGGVPGAGLLGHQLHDHLVAKMLQRGTEVEVSNSGLCCDLTVLNCYSELLPFHFKRFD